ncbi:MAG: hypothetical protein FGM54_10215 [Chitinophagaceae bacterium]|nr:hypothetical protein [Chitinophagaceae bacterium]
MKKWMVLALMVSATIPVFSQHKKHRSSKAKAKPTSVQTSAPVLLNNSLVLCPSIDSLPAWHLAEPADFKFPANYPVPTQYQLYGTIYKWFKLALTQIPYAPATRRLTLPVPVAGGVQCIDYQVKRVQTMDSALQAKYPQLMSFAASQVGNPLNDMRIDCDGDQISMMIRHQGETYFMRAMPYKGTYLFVAFNKQHAGDKKKPFEYKP